jgi:predicted nucleotide-binding protein (sugar kinase/HSP70/actin superfamily)
MEEFDVSRYPRFTKEMKDTHTILVPNMAELHFRIIRHILQQAGYHIEILSNCGSQVSQLGLKYVHNDTCYPALLVIGQFLDALGSGRYDLDHTALLITQTGGGCRASNYIHLLRKALVKAGYPQVPVASLNFSGLEKDSGFRLDLPLLRRLMAAIFYGDLLMTLRNQTAPYETERGAAEAAVEGWIGTLSERFGRGEGITAREMKRTFPEMVDTFARIPVHRTPKVKVGIVGEIYVKYSPLGNNSLEEFLSGEDCEVNVPGLMGFLQYCIFNMWETTELYGGPLWGKLGPDALLGWMDGVERAMGQALRDGGFHAPKRFKELIHLPEGIIGLGTKMGEGWLLTAEMVELVQSGYENIVCAQPFGCLPNHIVAKGMVGRIRALYPAANITPIDYDPSATKVNQENRIKLMLAVARERLHDRPTPPPAAARTPVPRREQAPALRRRTASGV